MSETAVYIGQPTEWLVPGATYSVNLMMDRGYLWVHYSTHIKHYRSISALLKDWKFVDHD
jgi:hypothetical protein